MEQQFWHQMWTNNTIGFHQTGYHPWLDKIAALKSSRELFVPLCGKSLDMWPLANYYDRLIGAELSEIACQDFFQEADLAPTVKRMAQHNVYYCRSAEHDIRLWQGDYFALTSEQIGDGARIDIFDRAALVALPEPMRAPYVKQLRTLCNHATLFILTLEFEQSQLSGPPFALNDAMIKDYFGFADSIEKIASQQLDDKIFAQRKLPVSELVESLYIIKW